MNILLAQSRDVTANAAEGRRSLLATETARHLLLHLRHAQVSLRLVVVKRHSEVYHEAQHCLLVVVQPHQQVVRFALFDPTPSRLLWRWVGWVQLESFGQQL